MPHANDPGGASLATASVPASPAPLLRLVSFISVLGPLAVALLPAAIRLAVLLAYGGAAPPGSDGGNWLAFSKELFGGHVKAAEAAYPPLFPSLLWLGGHFTRELLALKLLGLVSALAVGGAVYVVARTRIGNWPAAALAAAASSHPYAIEMLAWGGAPQLLGTAFLVPAVYLWVKGIEASNAPSLAAAAILGAVASATHQLVAIELVLAALFGVALVMTRKVMSHDRDRTAQSLAALRRVALLLVVLALVLAPFYYRIVANLAGNPANPLEMSLFDSVLRIGRWHGDNWIWVSAFVLIFPCSVYLAARGDKTAVTATALCVSAGLVLVVTQEVRSVHLLETGLLLGSAPVAVLFARPFRLKVLQRQTIRRGHRLGVVAGLVGVSLLLAGQGLRAASADFDWYRVIDRPAFEALEWIRSHRVAGEFAVAGQNERGGIYGWWVEGYAMQPTYLAIEDRWLSYRQEIEQASVARQLTGPERTAAEIAGLASVCRVRYVMVDLSRDAGLRSRLIEAHFTSAFESGDIAVVEFTGQFGDNRECPGWRPG
jgi:hypothetical protein